MIRHHRLLVLLVSFMLCGVAALRIQAQDTPVGRITYRLAMSRPASHLFEVQIEVEADKSLSEDHLDFQMPAWSPGRYGVFEFAKNVQDVSATATVCETADNCHPTDPSIIRMDVQTWRVTTASTRTVTFSYKVFSNDLSGTFSRLEERHANFNGGSIFMYLAGHKSNPVNLEIDPPKDWRIMNGYSTDPNQRAWQFANYDILMDTPTVVGPAWTMDEFKVGGKNFRVVVTSLGPDGGRRPELVRNVEKIVRAETAMWGPPECDNYAFLLTFAADDESGDGMEHLTSTNIIVPSALADDGSMEDILDAVSHEFFHTWNGKRLRPAELGPWDFTRPVNTRGLWIYEGLTNYYTVMMLMRAGLITKEQFLERYSRTITGVENLPGNRRMSAEISSLTASFQDGAAHAQITNFRNNSVNYYPKGETLGLVLDLMIRSKTGGRASLDEVMTRLYRDLYLTAERPTYYLRGRGYVLEDLIKVVSEVVGSDMHEFFRRYVSGTEKAPYNDALSPFGYQLTFIGAALPAAAGFGFDDDGAGGVKVNAVDNPSAAEDAGLSVDDTITEINGKPVTSVDFRQSLSTFKPGDTINLTYKRDRRTLKTGLKVGEPTRFNYQIVANPTATAAQKQLADGWMKKVAE
ncbi:MAG: PDZ domain-containing protein [Pyrinomonadaceae bacterium]